MLKTLHPFPMPASQEPLEPCRGRVWSDRAGSNPASHHPSSSCATYCLLSVLLLREQCWRSEMGTAAHKLFGRRARWKHQPFIQTNKHTHGGGGAEKVPGARRSSLSPIPQSSGYHLRRHPFPLLRLSQPHSSRRSRSQNPPGALCKPSERPSRVPAWLSLPTSRLYQRSHRPFQASASAGARAPPTPHATQPPPAPALLRRCPTAIAPPPSCLVTHPSARETREPAP